MNLWNQIPFSRFLLPFLAGILCAVYSGWKSEYILPVILILFVLLAGFVFIKPLALSYTRSWVLGLIITAALFLSGFEITVLHTDSFRQNHFGKFLGGAELFYVKTNEPWLEKEKSYKIAVSVLAVKQNGKWVETSGNAMCYFKKDSASKNIAYGNTLAVKTIFNEVKPPQNPAEFNYKRYLSFHNIYHQAYIPSGNWKLLKSNEGNPVIAWCHALREELLGIFRENKIEGDELAVASALVLGHKDYLDQELISAYASSGAMHVLAVSGLHVGIIYAVLNSFLLFFDRMQYGKIIKTILLLAALWFYATITGLSPSVLRAAAMFSCIVIAQSLRFYTNIFNTLFVCCFLLLLYNPYMIMEVGFQLSFLAVMGIISIQPWLYDKWRTSNWLLDKTWTVITVSIAAQAVTFPLGLLYFHQFPNYFLFSNLIVIPMAFAILCGGLIVFALGKIPVVGMFAAKIYSWLVLFLNESVRLVDRLPGAITEGVSINVLETWLIYFAMICLLLLVHYHSMKYFYAAGAILILLLSLQASEHFNQKRQKAFIVYHIPNTAAYDFISGNRNVFVADSALIQNESRMLFHVRHHWWERNLSLEGYAQANRDFKNDFFCSKNNIILFGSKKIAVVNEKIEAETADKFKVDYIILSKNPKISISDLKKRFLFSKVIIDSSNSEWKNKKWKEECEEMKVDYYSVQDLGAWVEVLL